MSLDTHTTLERAFGAFISAAQLQNAAFELETLADFGGRFKGDDGELVPLSVNCIPGKIGPSGEIPEEWGNLKLPALIVAIAQSDAHLVGYDVCDVQFIAITSPDEINAPTMVQRRIGWLSAIFDEDNLDAIAADLNAPAAGEDTRLVKGLQVIGIMRAGQSHAENGRHVLSTLKLEVSAIGLPDPV
jgi:hypothetical protein